MVSFATRSVLAVALSLATAMGVAAQDRYETTEIAAGVYQFRWIGHNAMFVTTDAGVVAFDPIGVDAGPAACGRDPAHCTGLPARRDRLQPQRCGSRDRGRRPDGGDGTDQRSRHRP